jgi:hypothetical protein
MDNYLLSLVSEVWDFEQKFKILMSHPIWLSVRSFVLETKDYENALCVVDILFQYLISKKDVFEKSLHEEYDKNLLRFRLELLDKADRWQEYIDFYNQILNEKPFYSDSYISYRNKDPILNKYILQKDEKNYYIHFLYFYHHRYEIICRKLTKAQSGKRLGNLYHLQRCDLTEEKLQEKYEWAIRLVKIILSQYKKINPL